MQEVLSEDERAAKWAWHAECIANADKAKAQRDMKAWEIWSQTAAELLVELV